MDIEVTTTLHFDIDRIIESTTCTVNRLTRNLSTRLMITPAAWTIAIIALLTRIFAQVREGVSVKLNRQLSLW